MLLLRHGGDKIQLLQQSVQTGPELSCQTAAWPNLGQFGPQYSDSPTTAPYIKICPTKQ